MSKPLFVVEGHGHTLTGRSGSLLLTWRMCSWDVWTDGTDLRLVRALVNNLALVLRPVDEESSERDAFDRLCRRMGVKVRPA